MRASWIFAVMPAFCAAVSSAFAAAAPEASGGKLSRYGIFVYSSICTQAGNATGNHVVLIRDGDRDILYWYWSEGAMKGPAQASPLAIDDKTGRIKFSVDTGSPEGAAKSEKAVLASYQGSISDDAITLTSAGTPPVNTAQAVTIPRVKDFSKKTGPCNPDK